MSSGHYCAGPTQPTKCPAGTYNPSLGQATLEDGCRPCLVGGYCLEGAVSITPCGAGTYNNRTGGYHAGSCTTCAAGYFCTGTPTPTPGPPGLSGLPTIWFFRP